MVAERETTYREAVIPYVKGSDVLYGLDFVMVLVVHGTEFLED